MVRRFRYLENKMKLINHKHSANAILDFHILWYKETKEQLERLLESIKDIGNINVDIVSGGFEGHIGNARIYGFGLRDSKYCSFIDPDDYLINPEHVEILIDELEQNKELVGVYTDYEAIDKSNKVLFRTNKKQWSPTLQLTNPFEVLHLKLYRRSAVMPRLKLLSETPTYEEILINGLVCEFGKWRKLDLCSYRKSDGGVSMRLASDDLLKKVIKTTTPFVMKQRGMGDKISSGLSKVGLKPCAGCLGRTAKLNQLFA